MTDVNALFARIKECAKPDANLAEIEDGLKSLIPPDDKDEALNWMKNYPGCKNAINMIDSTGYERGAKAFDTTKRADVEKAMRDTIYKELHPEESPLEKRVREQDERIKMFEEEKKRNERKIALMGKGKEVGIDSEIAADYAVFGDQADEVMKRHADHWKAQLDAVKTVATQNLYGGKTPVQGSSAKKSVKDMTPDEAMQYAMQGEAQKAEVLAAQKR